MLYEYFVVEKAYMIGYVSRGWTTGDLCRYEGDADI